MSQEINVSMALSVYKSSVMASTVGRNIINRLITMTGNYYIEGTVTIGTSPTAFPLGAITQPHWAFFLNADTTNYVQLSNGSGGAVLARLLGAAGGGEPALIPLDPGCVPYGLANTAPCIVEYCIFSL